MIELKDLKYNNNGLIPTIIQNFNTKKILMLGYMNEESLSLTIETKKTWFYSRSREKLWNKGETSGNYHNVVNISYDCDADALLVNVIPNGPTCHNGTESCFTDFLYQSEKELQREEVLTSLFNRIVSRKEKSVEDSYTKYLFDKGIDKILKKVGEETSEVIIAAKNDDKEELTYEICDLIYHLMVLMVENNVNIVDIKNELWNRYNK